MLQYFVYQNSKIYYTDIGCGNIVVLLHGFGEDASIWKQQAQFLSKKYRVIVPEIPGTGNSEMLDKTSVSINDYAICLFNLIEYIDKKNEHSIILLGHSMGGYITLAFANLFPQKLKAFGLIHSTAFADDEAKKQVRIRGIEMMKEYGAYSFLKNTIPNLFASEFKEENSHQIEALIENSKTFKVAALEQYYTAMMNRLDATNVLKQSSVPILFLMGTDDVAAPLNDVLQQCHLPTQSHLSILQNVGHMGMLESIDTTNNIIDCFITHCYSY